MFELELRTPSSEGLASQPPLWVHPDFLAAVADLHQAEAYQLVCRKGEQLVAVLPVFEKKNLGLRRMISPVSAYYQGLWFNWEEGRDANRNLLDELHICTVISDYLLKRYQRIQLNLAPHNYDVRGFTWSGLKALPLYTFVQDLAEPSDPLKDERKKLRLAQKQGYELEERFAPEEFIRLLRDLHTRKHQHFGVPYPELQNWMKQLHEKGLLTQFNLMQAQEIASSNIVLKSSSSGIAYTILRSTRPDDLKTGASTLHSQLLTAKLKPGFAYLDFCGANNPEVARFKAAMGFQLKVFFQLRK